LFLGGESDSDLDSLGLQLVKRVTEIVAHCLHERGVVSRIFAVDACVLKLRRRACESGSTEEGGTLKGPWNNQVESCACRRIEGQKILIFEYPNETEKRKAEKEPPAPFVNIDNKRASRVFDGHSSLSILHIAPPRTHSARAINCELLAQLAYSLAARSH
jgi:hypothetical protein